MRWYRSLPGTRVAGSGTTPTRLILQTKQGHSIASKNLPDVANSELEINVRLTPTEENGVIIAHGDGTSGYALSIQNGRPVFSIRSGGRVYEIQSDETLLLEREYSVQANLDAERAMLLRIDGEIAAQPRLAPLLLSRPVEPLDVGFDSGEQVAAADGLGRLSGTIHSIGVMFRRLDQEPRPTRLVSAAAHDWQASSPLTTHLNRLTQPDRSLHLNGYWDYGIAKAGQRPETWNSRTVVPYPVESSLSLVQRQVLSDELFWIKRQFRIPTDWATQTCRIHLERSSGLVFAQVDDQVLSLSGEATEAQTLDVQLNESTDREHSIVLAFKSFGGEALDELLAPYSYSLEDHPLRVTGALDSIWLEPVLPKELLTISATADLRDRSISVSTALKSMVRSEADQLRVRVEHQGKIVAQQARRLAVGSDSQQQVMFKTPIEQPRLWHPRETELYEVVVELVGGEQVLDRITTTCAFREFEVERDETGFRKFKLNGQPFFVVATPYICWWPESKTTPPSDTAIGQDLQQLSELGFNTLIVPGRHVTHRLLNATDRAGMLVMPGILPPHLNLEATEDHEATRSSWNVDALMPASFHGHPSLVAMMPATQVNVSQATEEGSEVVRSNNERIFSLDYLVQLFAWQSDVADQTVIDEELVPHRAQLAVLARYRTQQVGVTGHVINPYQSLVENEERDNGQASAELLATIQRWHSMRQEGLSGCVIDSAFDLYLRTDGLLTFDRQCIKVDREQIGQALRELSEPVIAEK